MNDVSDLWNTTSINSLDESVSKIANDQPIGATVALVDWTTTLCEVQRREDRQGSELCTLTRISSRNFQLFIYLFH